MTKLIIQRSPVVAYIIMKEANRQNNNFFKKYAAILLIFVLMAAWLLNSVGETVAALRPSSLGMEYVSYSGLTSKDVRENIVDMIRVAWGILGTVAVVIILIGGYTWMTAGGNDERVGQAKKWIYGGVIGLLIILSSYAIASWVIENLVDATTGTVHFRYRRKSGGGI